MINSISFNIDIKSVATSLKELSERFKNTIINTRILGENAEITFTTMETNINLSELGITKINCITGNIIKLRFYSNFITKIEGLNTLHDMIHLSLGYNKITKIEGLSELKSLQSLLIGGNPITKLEGLDKLDTLIELDIRDTKISIIENLSNTIPRIYHMMCNITGKDKEYPCIYALKDVPIIKKEEPNYICYKYHSYNQESIKLRLKKQGFYNIDFPDHGTNVVQCNNNGNVIDLDECFVKDIIKITGEKTELLFLSNNFIETIDVIDNLTNLKELYIFSNPIKKLPNLANFKKLSYISIYDTNIRVIENLPDSMNTVFIKNKGYFVKDKEYPKIKELKDIPIIKKEESNYICYKYNCNHNLYHNQYCRNTLAKRGFYDFDMFTQDGSNMIQCHSNEKIIDLTDCLIEEIVKITGKNIETLGLANNYIKNVSNIDTLTNLKVLVLSDNPIEKLPNLMNFNELATIYIKKTNVSVIENIPDSINSIIFDKEKIKSKDKEYSKIKELKDVPMIKKEIIIENKSSNEIANEIIRVAIEKKLKKGERFHYDKYYSATDNFLTSMDTLGYIFGIIANKEKILFELGLINGSIQFSSNYIRNPSPHIHIIDIIGGNEDIKKEEKIVYEDKKADEIVIDILKFISSFEGKSQDKYYFNRHYLYTDGMCYETIEKIYKKIQEFKYVIHINNFSYSVNLVPEPNIHIEYLYVFPKQ